VKDPAHGPMHPDTDELLFALEGTVVIELFDPGGNELVPLAAGSLVVVLRGRWNRHVDAEDLVELYHTPGDERWLRRSGHSVRVSRR
jgi:hypothetical protein